MAINAISCYNTFMQTMNISLPANLANKLDNAVRSGGYASRSEFVRTLIRDHAQDKKIELKVFKKQPLKKIETEFRETGLYSEKFIKSVMKGLSESSIYAND